MNPIPTTSILQRVPKILAVTAASYGLVLHARRDGHAGRRPAGGHPTAHAGRRLSAA